jgi:hypothetical protein
LLRSLRSHSTTLLLVNVLRQVLSYRFRAFKIKQ